jgi:hypothetical protein
VGRAAASLFIALTSLYLLTARGRITSIDEWHVYGTAESLVERRSWELRLPSDDPAGEQVEDVAPAKPERPYSRYSVVPSLLSVPFCKAAEPLADWIGSQPIRPRPLQREIDAGRAPPLAPRDVLQAATTFSSAFVTAATATWLFVGLCRLSIGSGAALAATLVFALGTLAWPYSGSLYVQPVAALGLVGVVVSAAIAADAWMAIALMFLFAVRLEFVVLLPVLALHVWRFRRPIGAGVAALVVGAAGGVGLNVLVNLCRGDPWLLGDYGGEAFSTPFWIGLHGVLFSSGKGLVWFAPAAALGLALMPWLMRVEPRVGFLAAGTSATMLVMVACWWTWHGGWSWGPRLLVPLMPVFVLPLAWLFDRCSRFSGGLRIAMLVVIAASVAVQIWGVVTDPVGDRGAIWPLIGGNENESIYVPQVGPWGVESSGGPDILWCRLWNAEPTWRPPVLAIVVGLALVCCVCLWIAARDAGAGPSSLRMLIPAIRPVDLFALAMCLVVLAAPGVVDRLLVADSPDHPRESATQLPPHLRRLQPDRTGGRLTGKLYIPIKGDYSFYQQGPPGTQFYLDGRPIFGRAPAELGSVLSNLDVGFHSLAAETRMASRFNTLYWTTPGNARYKEPIPRLYLASPAATWTERAAIVLAHWKWLVWAAAVVIFLCVGTRQNVAPERTDKVRRETLAPGENG